MMTRALVAVLAFAAATSSARAHGRDDARERERGEGKTVAVLTRNLYLGADLTPVIAAKDLASFVAATTAVWNMVNVNSFALRVEGIADEIADEEPDLVGLQEAYTWAIQAPGAPAPTVRYDYVAQLLDALRARGLAYEVAASVQLFRFAAPIATGETVTMTDHGVILARRGVKTSDPVAKVYGTLLPLSVLGQPLQVQRGWLAVDAKVRGERVRFVSTHLEAYSPLVRAAQAQELAAALAAEAGPVILVGDLNSTVTETVPQPPLPGARQILGAAGFRDAWATLHPADAGLTCCFPEDLRQLGALGERIDYVLWRGPLRPVEVEVLGATPMERVSGLWPSDHAGVAAELRAARRP
jgi:endonuclease/exonuclease/phosphatase family metal-dependent hydrolase